MSIEGTGVTAESTGPDKAVFPQPPAYCPHNSQFAAVGLLSADPSSSDGIYNSHMNSQ